MFTYGAGGAFSIHACFAEDAPEDACTHLMKALHEGLATDGQRVTVLTSGPRFGRAVHQDEAPQGSRVIQARNPFVRRHGVQAKHSESPWFFAFMFLRRLALRDVDILLVATTLPLAVLAAVVAARIKRAKLICNLQDLFPDSARGADMLRPEGLACAKPVIACV